MSPGQRPEEVVVSAEPPLTSPGRTDQPPALMRFQRELALQNWDTRHNDLPWIRDLERARHRVERAVRAEPAEPAMGGDDEQAQRRYLVARHAEVVARHTAQSARVRDLEDLLGSALALSGRFDLSSLRKVTESFDFEPGVAGVPLAAPVWADFAPETTSNWRRLLDDQKDLKVADARNRFQRTLRLHNDAEIARESELLHAQRRHVEEGAARDAEAVAHNDGLDLFARVLHGGDPGAVAGYFGLVLSGSVYPADFPHHFRLAYLPMLSELVVEVTLPNVEVVPTVSELQHVLESDEVAVRPRDSAQVESLYASVVAQVMLRTLYELFEADPYGWLETVTLNGMTRQVVSGPPGRRVCLVSVSTTREQFAGLDLAGEAPRANLAGLGAVVLYSCQRQEPIRDLSEVEQCQIIETNVLTDLDHRLDVVDVTEGQFEHLVHELLARMGLHLKQVRPRRDGVVDCLVFDERPVLGGTVVVHAVRHARSLDVWAVQRLQRAVTDCGASKGILITTAGIDPRSHAYASGKPLELIDGAGILGLIAQHTGIRAQSQHDRFSS